MARDKDKIIGGFDVFKAAQRAAQEMPNIPKRPDELQDPTGKEKEKPAQKIGTHIGRTVMPTKHHIMCYECSYEFDIAGKVQTTFCPKCRTNLTFEDLTVDEEYVGDLKTAGTITITENGVVKDGELFANFVVLHGSVEGGSLHAFRELELGSNARFDPDLVKSRDLKISEGAEYVMDDCRYHNVDVHGALQAVVHASGTVTVRSCGCLKGEVHSAKLVVEEGGGLLAGLHVCETPDDSEPSDDVEQSA